MVVIMSFNSFGKIFTFSSFGESHGKAIGVIVDGVPSGLKLSENDIQLDLDKRRPGQSAITTQRKEHDRAEIFSGIFEGVTTGSPIGVLIFNSDQRSKDYSSLKDLYRPGHADFTYSSKFGLRDYRGGGRSSARETAMRVVAGVVAKKILEKEKVKIIGYTKQVGNVVCEKINYKEIEKNSVRAPDERKGREMEKLIEGVKSEGDSVGGVVEIVAKNVPVGLGEPVYYKLDSKIAEAMMSINAVKGVEIGAGFSSASMMGSEHNDRQVSKGKFVSNNAGGIEGGISNGNDLILRIAIKPASSISKEQETINSKGKKEKVSVKGRHDPCLCPRAVPVAEAMLAIVLADLLLISRCRKV